MKKRTFLLLVTLLCMLSSCAKTPEEVQDEIKEYEFASTVDELVYEYASISEVIQNSKNMSCKQNTTNIIIDEIIVPNSEKMPTYKLVIDSSKYKETLEKICITPECRTEGEGYFIESNDKIQLVNDSRFYFEAPLKMYFHYPHEDNVLISDAGYYYGYDFVANELGIITKFTDNATPQTSSPYQFNVTKRYYSISSEISDSYSLYDGSKCSVLDIAEFAEQFCMNYFSESENNLFSYRANYVDVREMGDEKYGAYVSLCRVDKYGNNFDSIYAYQYELGGKKTALLAAPIYIWVTGKSYISEMERHYSFDISEETDNSDFLTLESAVNVLSNRLAQGKSYEFETAELKYIFEFTNSQYINDAEYFANDLSENEKIQVNLSANNILMNGTYILQAVPYWTFTKHKLTGNGMNNGTIYMVNALTGELRIENSNVNF